MREDPNLIFTLRPLSRRTEIAFQDPFNRRFYVPASQHQEVTLSCRESTPATNVGEDDAEGGNDENEFDHLCFTFDRKPRNIEQGFVFGSNPKTCDVILGKPKHGISSSHFRITFDSNDNLVLIDSSTHGTAVSYGGQASEEKRKNPRDRTQGKPRNISNDFTWILFRDIQDKRVTIGHNIDDLPNVGTGRAVLHILQNHYPERLGRALLPTVIPWYVTAFLKLVSPFIDPVTKTKIRYNEPLTDHIPASQLMKNAGGECEFEYDHSVYWPAFNALAEARRKERRERWEKAGKIIGESEIYLWGGDEPSVGANEGGENVEEVANGMEKLNVTATDEEQATAGVQEEKKPEVTEGPDQIKVIA